MDVSDLKQFFRSIESLVRVSGGAKAADEIERAAQLLEPFRTLDLKEFANFLIRAEEYDRTGIVPVVEPKGRGRRSSVKAGPEQTKAIASQILQMREQSVDASRDYDEIEREVSAILKKPTKDVVFAVSDELGLPRVFRTKAEAVREITRFVTEQRETYERTRF